MKSHQWQLVTLQMWDQSPLPAFFTPAVFSLQKKVGLCESVGPISMLNTSYVHESAIFVYFLELLICCFASIFTVTELSICACST
jgi:hypothetical protein